MPHLRFWMAPYVSHTCFRCMNIAPSIHGKRGDGCRHRSVHPTQNKHLIESAAYCWKAKNLRFTTVFQTSGNQNFLLALGTRRPYFWNTPRIYIYIYIVTNSLCCRCCIFSISKKKKNNNNTRIRNRSRARVLFTTILLYYYYYYYYSNNNARACGLSRSGRRPGRGPTKEE